MGVVYKLTPEVSSFIIEQKKNDPKITCKNLAGTVFLRFGQRVSKSSVHELLKQAHVITPRPRRKPKEKFQIPLEKKAEISKALSQIVPVVIAPNPPSPAKEESPVLTITSNENIPLQKIENPHAGNIFLESALGDLSFKPVLGMKQFSDIENVSYEKATWEWDYLNQQISAIKVDFGQSSFYIDSRFQGLFNTFPSQFSAPIERAAGEATDCVLNNIQPLIIREASSFSCFSEFISAFESSKGKEITHISLVGTKERVFVEFNSPMPYRRNFIVGISQIDELTEAFNSPEQDVVWQSQEGCRIRIIKDEERRIATNIAGMSREDLLNLYNQRHPLPPPLLSSLDFSLGQSQGQPWLKNKLKERVKIFFSPEASQEQVEQALVLKGSEAINCLNQRLVYLEISEGFEGKDLIRRAAENINGLAIKDFEGKNIRIFIDG